MKRYIFILIICIIFIIFLLNLFTNRKYSEASVLIEKSKDLIKDKEEDIKFANQRYLNYIFYKKPILPKSIKNSLNQEYSIDLVNKKVIIIVNKDECLNCLAEYIKLIKKYFNNDYIVISVGDKHDRIDDANDYPYSLWSIEESETMKNLVKVRHPVISYVDKNGYLEYTFLISNSNLFLCEEYLKILKEKI